MANKLGAMFRDSIQARVNWLLGLAVFLVTVAVTPMSNLDPINVPKIWVLCTTSFGILAMLLIQPKVLFNKAHLKYTAAAFSIFLFMLISMLTSGILLSQQLFGVNGRNTGLLTYLCFGILFIAAATSADRSTIKPIIYGIVSALGINAIYGYFQAIGKDPQNWSNPYTPVIGTLGNPNFAAAFLGMGMAISMTYLIAPKIKFQYRFVATIFIIIAIYDILKSDAQQGIIVSLLSAGMVGYFYLRYKLNSRLINIGYLVIGLSITILGILGALQKGPFNSLVYKASVTYRGDYWHAGIGMFKNHPWFGVGLDSYGDYYRSTRSLEATLRRGPSIVSNAAHNVFIDIATTAGIFALVSYVAVIFLGLKASWNLLKKKRTFDPFFISILVMWIGYLVQSAISINNLALGIWGWILPGLLIAIERWDTKTSIKLENKKLTTDFASLAMVLGLIVGGVVGYIPFNADANFRHALETGNPDKIEMAALKWPKDATRLNYAIQVFDQNKLQDKAVLLAQEVVKISPRNFEALYYLYNSPTVTANEKREILDRLKLIDPHNPDLAKLS